MVAAGLVLGLVGCTMPMSEAEVARAELAEGCSQINDVLVDMVATQTAAGESKTIPELKAKVRSMTPHVRELAALELPEGLDEERDALVKAFRGWLAAFEGSNVTKALDGAASALDEQLASLAWFCEADEVDKLLGR